MSLSRSRLERLQTSAFSMKVRTVAILEQVERFAPNDRSLILLASDAVMALDQLAEAFDADLLEMLT